MARNKLTDLNDHLFAQLERLGDESLDDTALAREIERSKAIAAIATNVIGNAKMQLDVLKAVHEYNISKGPAMFGLNDK